MLTLLNMALLFAWCGLLAMTFARPTNVFVREVVWTFACGMTTAVLTLSFLTTLPVSKPAEVVDVRLEQR